MAVSFHDGSRLPWWLARGAVLSVSASLEGRGGAIEVPRPSLVPGDTAVWHLKLDLYKLLSQYHVSSYRPIYGTFMNSRVYLSSTPSVTIDSVLNLRMNVH